MGSYFDGSQPGPFAGDPSRSGRGQGAAGGTPSGFLGLQTSSFTDFIAVHSPGLLPGRVMPADSADPDPRAPGSGFQAVRDLPHGTTIVAAVCHGGVVLAGDRRATAGSMIAKRDVEKVFRSDEFSGMGYAGTGSLGIEFVRLFQVELEHYEKMEGRSLSLEGKANRLAFMVRGNLGAAMQAWSWCRCSSATTKTAAAGGSSATTWPAARTRSSGSTPSARDPCSPGAR